MAASRILLLGGSGLLGSPAARALRDAGHDVTVVSRGRRDPVEGVRRVVADRADGAALAGALRDQRFDLAIDFLAFDGEDVDRVLSLPTTKLERYVLISSGQVYLVAREVRPPSREEDGELPLTPEPVVGTRDHHEWAYGAGKRRAEASVRGRANARGGADLILRLPVVQGAHDTSRRLWAYLERLLDGGPVLLPGGGQHPVRFVWAEDVASVLTSIAAGALPPGAVYNLAQPDEPRLLDLLASAANDMGLPVRFVPCTAEDLAEAGLDHRVSPFSGPWCSRPDPSRAISELGFRGTPSCDWLTQVIRAHRVEPAPRSHPGYSVRARELELASRLEKA